MQFYANPHKGEGEPVNTQLNTFPSVNAKAPRQLLERCPVFAPTPLISKTALGGRDAALFIKDERERMGVGSFKALGAAYVIAEAAQHNAQEGITYVTASAGNHGISVAAGANVFGAQAVIYLSHLVPKEFAARLEEHNARVVWAGEDYAASLEAAEQAAADNGWTLLSDTSWDTYLDIPHRLMEGYTVMAAEVVEQIPAPPTHILLQAGVGGLASAAAVYFRAAWGDAPEIIVVEPDRAAALFDSIKQGVLVTSDGPESSMGRLDCKTPSLIAYNGLKRDADTFVVISDEDVEAVMPLLAENGLETTPSGGATLAAYLKGIDGIDKTSRVLCIISEQAV